MSVMLRGNKFHYRFRWQGQDYTGPCSIDRIPKGATAKVVADFRKKALEFESQMKERVSRETIELADKEREIRMNKTVTALVENYKFELTGGSRIAFNEAFPLAAAKPSKREAKSNYAKLRGTYWDDFSAFMAEKYPDIKDLSAVRRAHCEAYVSYLVKEGRFVKDIKFTLHRPHKRKKTLQVEYKRDFLLSPKTIKEIVGACRWVFGKLEEDAGITRDPWKDVVLPAADPIPRDIFTPEELKRIWDGMQDNPFCYHLFIIAANSGMPEGDICMLEWADIDWKLRGIVKDRRKTGVEIDLPFMPQLEAYLKTLPHEGKYVSMQHAQMYMESQPSVSERVMAFLHGLGIETTVKREGRKAQSVKDLHSMRHVFCYSAKRAGIPDTTIQRFVGHRLVEMTRHYAAHDTFQDLHAEIKKLPPIFGGELIEEDSSRKRLADLAYTLPLEDVERLLSMAAITVAV